MEGAEEGTGEVQNQSDPVVQSSENLNAECEIHACSGETGDATTLEKVADGVPLSEEQNSLNPDTPLSAEQNFLNPDDNSKVTEAQETLTTHSDSHVKTGTNEVIIEVCDRNTQDKPPNVHGDSNIRGSQCISFQDVTYKVKQSKHCKRISSKVILNSVRYGHRLHFLISH